jgi:3-keto-L-gulonate-6-phosphate decarboxylase
VDGYQNYESSSFENAGPLLDDDDELEAIWKKEFSLKEQIADSKFKSYDELQARLNKVLGLNGETVSAKTTVETIKEQAKKAPKIEEDAPFEPEVTEDDDLSYFAKLAEED